MDFTYTLAIILLPLVTFLTIGLLDKSMPNKLAGVLGTASIGTSFLLACYTAYQYFFVYGMVDGVYQKIIAYHITWLKFTDTLHIDLGVILDPISVMMLLVVTTVSLMVHIYSNGYMHGERGFNKFFSFLSLFSFSMLGLVVATNLFQMYIFWELVGVSSFLLIGYYYEKPSAVAASKKAFITTRFADLGFLIGILLLSWYTGTFDFVQLTQTSAIGTLESPAIATMGGISFMGLSVISWALILIFMGGAGKSAMFPLHIWLPDAMEGPTPVSALIHAATMVVAGVFLVARLFPIYAIAAPDALTVVMWVGAFSSLFAAIIACTQYDIKRVLAFSTMSQIGYMMLALGVSKYGGENGLGFTASMFHLTTHAMFKALLFLGAGSIIHAVHSNSMLDMGGLRKYMPITFITFGIAWLAICGFPGLSGFFSKDEILVAAMQNNTPVFIIAVVVAGLTAFYMSRLFFSVFFGKETKYHHTPHESPKTMTIPLMVLAFFAIFAGYIPFSKFVTSDGAAFATHFHWNVAIPVTLIAFIGMGIAYVLYFKESTIPTKVTKALKGVYTTIYNKFYIDEIYLFVTKKILFNIVARSIAWFDRHVIDATMNGFATVTNYVSNSIKGLQSGQVQKYGLVFLMGALTFALIFIYLVTK
ncbi:MAG: NADH-quinone oxidoreductase subunit L [Bacteroidales bacterium]|jgi:NADH-quinone oxidoreductase subunit L|nr:NADH-quinone oxidoreductase subunit L [Bacteroidales bacterium]